MFLCLKRDVEVEVMSSSFAVEIVRLNRPPHSLSKHVFRWREETLWHIVNFTAVRPHLSALETQRWISVCFVFFICEKQNCCPDALKTFSVSFNLNYMLSMPELFRKSQWGWNIDDDDEGTRLIFSCKRPKCFCRGAQWLLITSRIVTICMWRRSLVVMSHNKLDPKPTIHLQYKRGLLCSFSTTRTICLFSLLFTNPPETK